MKNFLINSITFVGIIIIYMSSILIINKIIYSVRNFPLSKTKILIIGDSHIQKGINPKLLSSASNISQTAEPYILTYWKLKEVFKKHKPQTVLIGFSYNNISGYNDLKFNDPQWSSEMFKRSYTIQNFNELNSIDVNYKDFLNIYIKNMMIYPQLNHYKFLGKYSNRNTTSLNDLENAISRHYFINNKLAEISTVSIIYLDSIISLCKINNVVPILVGTPVHEEYYKQIPNRFKVKYEEIKSKYINEEILIIDKSQTEYKDEIFLNVDHLNSNGAEQFTKELNQILKVNKD